MAFFGRETPADRARAERARQWFQARSPYALFSGMFGVLAIVDSFTGVLGVAFGIAAIVLAVKAIRELDARPELLGRRLCYLGYALGGLGVAIGVCIWVFLY
jgi:hypothetical protein